jgi:hypothetical protein
MQSKLALWIAVLAMVFAKSVSAQTPAPLRILFIGNSYTYYNNMPEIVAAMGNSPESPRQIQVKAVTQGGATLDKVWALRATSYALTDTRWDVVVLQEQSTRPINAPELMLSAMTEIDTAVRKSGARTVLYMTWSRKGRAETQAAITAAYNNAAHTLSAGLAPVGLAWHRALAQDPNLELYAQDGSHPSPAGSYLAACVLYMTLIERAPTCPAITVTGVTAEDAKRLRTYAARP